MIDFFDFNNNYLAIGLTVLALGVISLLVVIIYYQQKKIKDLTTPKYGFLGKPLNVMIIGIISVSIGFLAFYAPNYNQNVPDSSADKNLSIKIEQTQIPSGKTRLVATPLTNSKPYVTDEFTKYDVFWRIYNKDTNITNKELSRGIKDPSNYEVQLNTGKYTVEVTIIVDEYEIKDSLEIEIK